MSRGFCVEKWSMLERRVYGLLVNCVFFIGCGVKVLSLRVIFSLLEWGGGSGLEEGISRF